MAAVAFENYPNLWKWKWEREEWRSDSFPQLICLSEKKTSWGRSAKASDEDVTCSLFPGALSTWRPSTGHDLHMFTPRNIKWDKGIRSGSPRE